ARELDIDASEIEIAMLGLENQGVVLRGRFTYQAPLRTGTTESNGDTPVEWCDRRLLARIHRLTLDGLRRQIAAAPPEQFVRFLARHQHLHPSTRLREQAGLLALVEQMEGFEAPAGRWAEDLLPTPPESDTPERLDGLPFFGQAVWGRLRPLPGAPAGKETNGPPGNGRPMRAMTRSTPITLMLRDDVSWLLAPVQEPADTEPTAPLGGNAR